MKSIKFLSLALAILFSSIAATTTSPAALPLPTAPVITAPTYNGLVGLAPTLKWSASTPMANFNRYVVKVATDASFASVTIVVNVSVAKNLTSYAIPAGILGYGKIYYWRVTASQSATGCPCTAWSVSSFHTVIHPPTLIDPANLDTSLTNANLLTLRPTFQWTGYAGAQNFTLQVATDYSFTALVLNVPVPLSSTGNPQKYTPIVNLPAATDLYWRVSANHSYFGPSWSGRPIFTTPNPPSIPVPFYPANAVLTNDASPRLAWKAAIVASGTTFDHYEVEISDTAGFHSTSPYYRKISDTVAVGNCNNILSVNNGLPLVADPYLGGNATHNMYQILDKPSPDTCPLPGGRQYFWRVRAYNTDGIGPAPDTEHSVWSRTFYMLIVVDPPVLTLPANGSVVKPTIFRWLPSYAAEAYTIQVTPDPTFATVILNTEVFVPYYQPVVGVLQNHTLYYWRVFAQDGIRLFGRSFPSEIWTFKT